MAQLVGKIDAKIAKMSKLNATKWLICPDNISTKPRQFNAALTRANMRAVLLSEEMN